MPKFLTAPAQEINSLPPSLAAAAVGAECSAAVERLLCAVWSYQSSLGAQAAGCQELVLRRPHRLYTTVQY